jgi:hypothetical protein
MLDCASDITPEHIERFQKRARSHFGISYILLFLICALFFFAVYVFSFAQYIDKRAGSVEVLNELNIAKDGQAIIVKSAQTESDLRKKQAESSTLTGVAELTDATIAYIEARTKLQLIEAQERLMIETGYIPDIETPRSKEELMILAKGKKQLEDELTNELALFRRHFNEHAALSVDVIAIERVLKQRALEREIFDEKAKRAQLSSQIKIYSSNLDTIELVRTSLIRFGGVAVVLFLVSLLTPIYRYNVRLGTFYLARADALILARDTKVRDFGEMLKLLTPSYAFEKEPVTPVESIAAFAREAGTIARKG